MHVRNCIDTLDLAGASEGANDSARRSPARGAAVEVLFALFDRLAEWQQRARQRRELGQMTDREIKDIGLSRADAEREASKPFWRR